MTEQAWPPEIEQAEFISLTTFRRSGVAVATTVWFVVDANALLVTTMDTTGKAKRLRHTSRVTLCVCDRRGHVKGREYEGTAELLAGGVANDIRRRVIKRYGVRGLDPAVVDTGDRSGAQPIRPNAGRHPDRPHRRGFVNPQPRCSLHDRAMMSANPSSSISTPRPGPIGTATQPSTPSTNGSCR